jgi:hypothetical protein
MRPPLPPFTEETARGGILIALGLATPFAPPSPPSAKNSALSSSA